VINRDSDLDGRPYRAATDSGRCSRLVDAHDRWEDILALRLALQETGRWAVINEGIGGNTVTGANLEPAATSPPGIERLDRAVLSHAGVTHVVVYATPQAHTKWPAHQKPRFVPSDSAHSMIAVPSVANRISGTRVRRPAAATESGGQSRKP
jgi:hypothetical protein